MNRTVLWELSLTALLMMFACGGSDDSDNSDDNSQSVKPVSRNWVFTINGQSAHPGDTIQIPHGGSDIKIEWQDADNPIRYGEPTNTSLEVASGNVFYTDEHWNWWWFASGPGIVKFVLHDYGTQSPQRYAVYVDITPMDLKGRIDITGTIDGYYKNNKYIQGPFLKFYLNEDLRRMFMTEKEIGINSEYGVPIMADVPWDYFKITSFGNERETCYPSSKDWGWFIEFKWVNNTSQTSNGETFYGKINSAYADYWFFKFDYGDYSYEIRKYKGSNSCLWNGEWENK